MSLQNTQPSSGLGAHDLHARTRRLIANARVHSYGRPTSFGRIRHSVRGRDRRAAGTEPSAGNSGRLITTAVLVVSASIALAGFFSVVQAPSLPEAMLSALTTASI